MRDIRHGIVRNFVQEWRHSDRIEGLRVGYTGGTGDRGIIHVPVIIKTDEDGIFIVSCPRFRGCHSYGKTIDEALERIREAIAVCVKDF